MCQESPAFSHDSANTSTHRSLPKPKPLFSPMALSLFQRLVCVTSYLPPSSPLLLLFFFIISPFQRTQRTLR